MKSVTCPYCQKELTGEFHPGDMIECDSCKGKFQPPPDMLRAVSPVEATCPFCKTVFIVDSPSHFIQCPLCNGKFTIGLATQNSTAFRPKSVKWATILLASSILIGSILYAILFAMGLRTGSLQLLNTSVQRSLVTLPWQLLTVMIAWKLFKGRNWARILFNIIVPIGVLFALMQAVDRHFIYLTNPLYAHRPAEVIFWLNLLILTVLGIVALCYLNSTEARDWFRLPKERKTGSDFPWWTIVLLLVLLCPILLLLMPTSPRGFAKLHIRNEETRSGGVRQLISSICQKIDRSDEYTRRARYLAETLAKIKASDGDTQEALYSTSKGFGIEGKPLSRWFEMVQSERFVSDANQTIQGRDTFDEVEIAILTAAGKRGLLNGDLGQIDNGPIYVNGYGLVRNRKELEDARIWMASRKKEQTYVARKIDFLARFFDPEDRAQGFAGSTLWTVRQWALGTRPWNRGDAAAQEKWDWLVEHVDDRYWTTCSNLGFRKEDVGESSPTRKAVSAFFRNPAAAMSLVMVPIPGKNYMMGRYEVTQALWKEVMDDNPSYFIGESQPVENVSWDDCQVFLKKLNDLPEIKESGFRFRLPTYAEWGYACLSGSTGKFCKLKDGTDISEKNLKRVAWFGETDVKTTQMVGKKEPNAFGLFDMLGNVCEWCHEQAGDACKWFQGNVSDRIVRGGCWDAPSEFCKVEGCNPRSPVLRDECTGLRLCVDTKGTK